LRDRAQRRAFVARAKQLGLSAIQSHLLITDGALDVRNVSGAPRFRRRILFSYADGSYGILTQDGRENSCGTLDRSRTAKLSNILVFTQD